jgi:hypothetical protein
MASDDDRELERLAALHVIAARACVEHFRSAPAFVVPEDSTRAFSATYPIVAHAIGQVAAALILRDQGLDYVARANVRVAFEHALLAQSVVHTPDGEDPLIASMNKLQRNMLRDLKTGGAELSPEMLAEADAPFTDPEAKVADIADRFDGGSRSIYGLYRNLTGAVHVSLATIGAYMELRGEDQPPRLLRDAKPDTDPYHTLALGWSAILAVSAVESYREGDPYREWINTTAREQQVVPDLGPNSTHWPPSP